MVLSKVTADQVRYSEGKKGKEGDMASGVFIPAPAFSDMQSYSDFGFFLFFFFLFGSLH